MGHTSVLLKIIHCANIPLFLSLRLCTIQLVPCNAEVLLLTTDGCATPSVELLDAQDMSIAEQSHTPEA